MRFCMGAENAKMKSAEKSAETGGHRQNYGNNVFLRLFIYFCDTLDISLCSAQCFSRPQSITTSHLSHSHSLRFTSTSVS